VTRMSQLTRFCEEPDPEDDGLGGDQVRCDFLRGHPGVHSFELERMQLECSISELERERRARAARRSKERKAG